MHRPFLAAAAALAMSTMAFAAPALARGFEVVSSVGDLSTVISAIEVTVADEAVGPQRNLGASRHRTLDTIGESDVDDVVRQVSRRLEDRLGRDGIYNADAVGGARLLVTVTKARASNLQFTEYGRVNNLRSGSVAAGGGEFEAVLVSAAGDTLAEYHYSHFETSLDRHFPPVGTWYDLRRSASWFSGHLADEFGQVAIIN